VRQHQRQAHTHIHTHIHTHNHTNTDGGVSIPSTQAFHRRRRQCRVRAARWSQQRGAHHMG
jgi:hypothetical protein